MVSSAHEDSGHSHFPLEKAGIEEKGVSREVLKARATLPLVVDQTPCLDHPWEGTNNYFPCWDWNNIAQASDSRIRRKIQHSGKTQSPSDSWKDQEYVMNMKDIDNSPAVANTCHSRGQDIDAYNCRPKAQIQHLCRRHKERIEASIPASSNRTYSVSPSARPPGDCSEFDQNLLGFAPKKELVVNVTLHWGVYCISD
jgi:hypothetical protein